MKKTTIVVEELNLINTVVIYVYVLLGKVDQIHYLDASKIAQYLLKYIVPRNFTHKILPLGHIQSHRYGDALDLVDAVYLSTKEKNPYPVEQARHLDPSALEKIFKKNLATELANIMYLHDTSHKIRKKDNAKVVLLDFSSQLVRDIIVEKFHGRSNYESGVLSVINRLSFQFGKIVNNIVLIAIPVFLIYKTIQNLFKKINHKSYKYVVLINSAKYQFRGGGKYYDFIIDEKSILTKETLFLQMSKLTQLQTEKQTALGRNISPYLSDMNALNYAQSKSILQILRNIIPEILRHLFYSTHRYMNYGFKTYIVNYIRWNLILQNYTFQHLITFNDEQAGHIARNSILSKAGVETWYYSHSAALAYCINSVTNPVDKRHLLWSYLNYDHFVTWNEAMREYILSHPVFFRKVHVIGCLMSSLIEQSINDSNQKNILVFDTSYDRNIAEGVKFYHDIAMYAQTHREVSMVFKPKKNISFYVPGNNMFSTTDYILLAEKQKEIERIPNIKIAPHDSDAYKMISWADVIVTHAISSTTIEAIGMRKRGVFYDPSRKYLNTHYDKVPKFILNSKAALWERLDELLNMGHDEYEKYLNENCKDVIDPYLDGKALARFRDLLAVPKMIEED